MVEQMKPSKMEAKSFKALTKFSAGKIVAISPEYQQAVDKAKFTIDTFAE